jgi:hypothetical protein
LTRWLYIDWTEKDPFLWAARQIYLIPRPGWCLEDVQLDHAIVTVYSPLKPF